MATFKFYLDTLEIDEPIGFSDLEISIVRDITYHGIGFEASLSSLQFYGRGADYLRSKKNGDGISANVIFRALMDCDDNGAFDEIYRGKVNIGGYKESCGTQCLVAVPVEEDSCIVMLRSRLNQSVDLDNANCFDRTTTLANYIKLNFPISLPAHQLPLSTKGNVATANDVVTVDLPATLTGLVEIRPTYAVEIDNSIKTGQLVPGSNYGLRIEQSGQQLRFADMSPQLLFEESIDCSGPINYSFRLKGSYNFTFPANQSVTGYELLIVRWNGVGEISTDGTVISSFIFPNATPTVSPITGTFDQTFSGTITLAIGEALYAFMGIQTGANPAKTAHIVVTWQTETNVNITTTRNCPPTNANVYGIHEALSRMAESITNNCTRVKSMYYGRPDSQPFNTTPAGCGGNRILTSGLKIRNAVPASFFANLETLLKSLNAIDNIGFDLTDDPDIAGKFLMRIEAIDFFYRDEEILITDAIPDGLKEVQEVMYYSKVLIGYKRWEVESIKGLDELNSNREYRTDLIGVTNQLEQMSEVITGSYAIEITRQQSFADSGGADTTYDNETFLICIKADYTVELGNITTPANIFSPSTLYNYRITPIRNLMRWFRSIIGCYTVINNVTSKLFFSAGTGNFTASGMMLDSFCRLEKAPIAENKDLHVTDFSDPINMALPLWKNETITFDYPLTLRQYNEVKLNPYGYVSYQCGDGDFEKGFINEIKYRLVQGMATFTLRKKWE